MLDCDVVERAGWAKLLGKYWARILIQEAQGKRMEEEKMEHLGDDAYRETRRRKRWREPGNSYVFNRTITSAKLRLKDPTLLLPANCPGTSHFTLL